MKLNLLLAVLLSVFLVNCSSPANFRGPGATVSGDQSKNTTPDDGGDEGNPTPPPPDVDGPGDTDGPPPQEIAAGECDPANVERIEVRASGVRLVGVNGSEVALAPDQEVISLIPDEKSFRIEMSATLRASMLKLKLNSEEQVAVLKSGARVVLFTPSQTQDGLKFQISRSQVLENGNSYDVTPHFDFEKSLIPAGNGKCILLPVIHSADMTQAAQDL